MPTFSADDGTRLAYHVAGGGAPPLVCVPGGPMRDSRYLGDLGGLSSEQQLIRLDLRGTGDSAAPADLASCRCDRLADDVRALQEHLGLDRVDLLGHSAGANIVVQFAARYPERAGRLVLAAPSTRAVGLDATSEMRRAVVARRAGEPWFAAAAAAFERIQAGEAADADWTAIAPLRYGRWDAAAQADHALSDQQVSEAAAQAFGAPGAFTPEATRAALGRFRGPVLVLAGELDLNTVPPVAAQLAGLFPAARLELQPGAGHSPWLDDADRFAAAVTAFLR